jgi:hypothetical protein
MGRFSQGYAFVMFPTAEDAQRVAAQRKLS